MPGFLPGWGPFSLHSAQEELRTSVGKVVHKGEGKGNFLRTKGRAPRFQIRTAGEGLVGHEVAEAAPGLIPVQSPQSHLENIRLCAVYEQQASDNRS